jgi:ABC-type sugar transport system ATPase subunit
MAVEFLRMRGIVKHYGASPVLRAVNFSAEMGEVHALVGENGAGKSTLMKILAGGVMRDSGEIFIANEVAAINTPHDAHQLGIKAVYQEFSLIPHLSIAENILLGQMPKSSVWRWVNWTKVYEQARQTLAEIGFGDLDVRTLVSYLSVPQQQMVEIAKAVIKKPRILILDEPSAVLSQEELKHLFSLIDQLKGEGTLIVYISHRLDEVFQVADRITVLKDGEIVGTVRPSDIDQNQLIKMMVGRTLEEIYPPRRTAPGAELLRANRLSAPRRFSDISFSLRCGEILGMFGLVGSGRTEIARCIFGADPLLQGEVYINGQPTSIRAPRQALNAGIGFLTEDRKRNGLVLTANIRDNISLASYPRMTRWGILNPGQQETLVQQKVNELNIRPPQLEKLVWQLSGGNQQRVALAKWLLVHANILILDEPSRGVDVATKVQIYHAMRDIAESGVGILFISSEMIEILGMSDRILVMREGRIAGELTRAEANEERLITLAAGLDKHLETHRDNQPD